LLSKYLKLQSDNSEALQFDNQTIKLQLIKKMEI